MQARPCIERGEVEEILDADLAMEGCNMKVMLKMGELSKMCGGRPQEEAYHDSSLGRT